MVGVSSARNLGIEKASGEFIAFVDSDDYIEEPYIENFMKEVELDTQIVRFIPNRANGKLRTDTTEFLSRFEETGDFNSACKQIIKTEIIRKNHIQFNTQIRFAEDMLFSVTAILHAKEIKTIDYNGYGCFGNSESTTRIVDKKTKLKNIYEISIAYSKLYELFEQFGIAYHTNKMFEETNRYILEMNGKCKVLFKEFSQTMQKFYQNLGGNIFAKFDDLKKYPGAKKRYIALLRKKRIKLYYFLLYIRKIMKGKEDGKQFE